MSKIKTQNLELLAPAGNIEKMKTAFVFGADAVYAGIPDFSLRVRINDFDLKKIKEATRFAHEQDKKIYITINIFVHNRHIEKIPKHIKELKKIEIDALIISDPGIIDLVKEIWPEAEIHLSTQANCTNWRSAKFWFKQGIKRVILGRETTLTEIKEIKKQVPKLELEYFVHGAMCMAYSGRCFLSKYFLDRSGNLGDCVQPCRWKYSLHTPSPSREGISEEVFISEEKRPNQPLELIEEDHGSYILNSKDLCLIKYLKDLADAGVTSFKIEGRAKSVYYQAVVNGIYKRAIHNLKNITKKELDYLFNELNTKLVHRGYTTGFLLGEKADQEINNTHQKTDWEFCGQVVKKSKSKDKKIKWKITIKVHNTLKVGDEIEMILPNYDIIKMKLDKMIDIKNNKEIKEAHGGDGGQIVIIEINKEVPELSVLRRKIK